MTIAAPHTLASTSTAEEYAERMMSAALGWIDVMSAYLGDRLGWYRSLAEHGPSSPDQLAERTGTQHRYAREWLEQQAVSGVLLLDESEDGTRRYTLPDTAAEVLLDGDSLNYLGPLPRVFAAGLRGATKPSCSPAALALAFIHSPAGRAMLDLPFSSPRAIPASKRA